MPACSDGLRGRLNVDPRGPWARAGALMENGTAGWGGSPPPQPTEASPSERWSQAWAEKFSRGAADADGTSGPEAPQSWPQAPSSWPEGPESWPGVPGSWPDAPVSPVTDGAPSRVPAAPSAFPAAPALTAETPGAIPAAPAVTADTPGAIRAVPAPLPHFPPALSGAVPRAPAPHRHQ